MPALFSLSSMSRRVRRPRGRSVVLGAVLLALAAAGTTMAAAGDDEGGRFRTVVVEHGAVEEVMTLTGTVDAARRADVTSTVEGTVASVRVAEEERVRAGQVLVTLERAAPRAAVRRARAGLAQAQAAFAEDQAAQIASATEAAAARTETSASTPAPADPTATAPQPSESAQAGEGAQPDAVALPALIGRMTEQQQAVSDAQSVASAALTTARAALARQTEACASSADGAPSTEATSSDGAPASDAAAPSTEAAELAPACTTALVEVQSAQSDAAAAQEALQVAITDLATTLGEAGVAVRSAASAPGSQATQQPAQESVDSQSTGPSETGPSREAGNTATEPASTRAVTAAQLALDQAAIDQARADLARARQDLKATVVRAPRGGRVVRLDVSQGDVLAAGETALVIFAGKQVAVELALSEEQVADVEIGQQARVAMPGQSEQATGTVSAVAAVGESADGVTSYAATVVVPEPVVSLPSGASARVEVVVGEVADALRVPVSAVTVAGERATVRFRSGDSTRSRQVQVGRIGDRYVEIIDGLAAGDRIVLADLDAAIEGAGTQLRESGSRGFQPPDGMRGGGARGTAR